MLLRRLAPLAAVFAAFCLPPFIAHAEEELGGDPWAEGREEPLDLDQLAEDEPPPEQEGVVNLPTRLLRCRMDALESARYSIAELRLKRADAKGAIATLTEILEATKREAMRDLTNLNLAILHDRWLHDHEGAAKHYKAVAGILRHAAHKRLLAMLARAGKADEAGKVTEDRIANAKEKGEKLALLHRLAIAYKRSNLPERALAVYERIAKEYTPKDIQEIIEAAEREAVAGAQKLHRLQEAEQDDAAERLLEFLTERRPQELRAAGRWDELAAFERARDRALQQLNQLEPGAEPEMPPEPAKKAEF